jgi:hypothetical protein
MTPSDKELLLIGLAGMVSFTVSFLVTFPLWTHLLRTIL